MLTYESQLNKYEGISQQLKEEGVNQVSYTDPDARILPKGDFGNYLGYRIQCGADQKYKMVCSFDVSNENDINQGAGIAKQAKENIKARKFNGLFDKGYHSGPQMALMTEEEITTYISIPRAKDREVYSSQLFKYNKRSDTYTCPAGQKLKTTGTIFNRKGRTIKNYTNSKACRSCVYKPECTTRKQGRVISRYDHYEYVEANRKRVQANPNYYRTRSQIIEHIFGTIKRHWGLGYTLLRTKEKVKIEYAIAFSSYSLKRIASIFRQKELNKSHISRIINNYLSGHLENMRVIINKMQEIMMGSDSQKFKFVIKRAYRPV